MQRPARLDPELVDEVPTSITVRRQRLRLPIRAVQGEHELAPDSLAERVILYERLELPDEVRMTSEREVSLDSLLERQ